MRLTVVFLLLVALMPLRAAADDAFTMSEPRVVASADVDVVNEIGRTHVLADFLPLRIALGFCCDDQALDGQDVLTVGVHFITESLHARQGNVSFDLPTMSDKYIVSLFGCVNSFNWRVFKNSDTFFFDVFRSFEAESASFSFKLTEVCLCS